MQSEEALNNESHPSSNEAIFEKKIPVAVLVLVLAQLVAGIWAASGFYSNQTALASQFEKNFDRIEFSMKELEEKMYTRQEAMIQLEGIRQTDVRQDQEIRELENDLRDILIDKAKK